MINNSYPNVRTLIINVLEKSTVYQALKVCRQEFINNVFICFMSIKGKINFLQMARFTDKCEQYFRINFKNKLNFQQFNLSMLKERLTECVVAFDPSYIKKSGRKTFGLGMYWSGCSGKAKWGLDICGFAVVDIMDIDVDDLLKRVWTNPKVELLLNQFFEDRLKEAC